MQDLKVEKIIPYNIYFSISECKQLIDESYLVIDRGLPREYYYDDIKASEIVESILLPRVLGEVIYLHEEDSVYYSSIDGKQRILSMIRFINNEFPLTELKKLKELNGKYFRDLDSQLQRKYEKWGIWAILLKKES
ncbi:conserved hypothetical protein [Methanococcus maripaludis C5]|uniref:DUF262 domain-containing protein n=3 Tax=Methanococcus maripaludis TaxID=39152 RepID=A4FXL0_METM5|nr:hypothetical protein [Methanococcus maripaludis]ABO34944.1 conserved hypothetical protein [Methanococcus maripaludis C5]MDK2929418.1 hypothetical protein [Methanococcus sp.]BAP60912.1 hypothetical protein MMKA1_07950 [Methanococcus maripaludis KA1]BAP62872.1 hypothetical protein MMOS7_07860 [Methanococcus maripaludis OS7]